MSRTLWFVAGSAAGAYAVTRARRTAEAFTYDGLHDRLSGLFVGARMFADEVRTGAEEKEAELRATLSSSERQLESGTHAPPPLTPPLTLLRGNDD